MGSTALAKFVGILPCLLTGATSHAKAPEPPAAAAASGPAIPATKDFGAADFVANPPTRSQVSSPNGDHVFVVHSPDAWQSKRATGRLFKLTSGGLHLEWERELPQEYGPRYFLVGNQGQTVLFDEWINIKSRYAVVLIHPKNNLAVTHGFDSVAATLNMPVAAITARAKHGWWIDGLPWLDSNGDRALVATGGKCLAISLNSGQLSLAGSLPLNCRP